MSLLSPLFPLSLSSLPLSLPSRPLPFPLSPSLFSPPLVLPSSLVPSGWADSLSLQSTLLHSRLEPDPSGRVREALPPSAFPATLWPIPPEAMISGSVGHPIGLTDTPFFSSFYRFFFISIVRKCHSRPAWSRRL